MGKIQIRGVGDQPISARRGTADSGARGGINADADAELAMLQPGLNAEMGSAERNVSDAEYVLVLYGLYYTGMRAPMRE